MKKSLSLILLSSILASSLNATADEVAVRKALTGQMIPRDSVAFVRVDQERGRVNRVDFTELTPGFQNDICAVAEGTVWSVVVTDRVDLIASMNLERDLRVMYGELDGWMFPALASLANDVERRLEEELSNPLSTGTISRIESYDDSLMDLEGVLLVMENPIGFLNQHLSRVLASQLAGREVRCGVSRVASLAQLVNLTCSITHPTELNS